ncbi:MAG: hypothetical protein HZA24_06090 [Nitrospirae bacterium]|nr:hypothetical protein [Nitrospirota bacterium]
MLLILDTPLSGGGGLILADPTAAPIAGAASGALPALLGGTSGTYQPPVAGAAAGQIPALTGVGGAAVTEPVGGAGAGLLPALAGSAAATVAPPVTAAGAGALPPVAGAASGAVAAAVSGAAAGTLPALAGHASDAPPEVVVPFGPGETYTTLAAAVAGSVASMWDLAGNNIVLVFEATSAFADTAPVGLNTTFPNNAYYATDAQHPIIIRAAAGARHTGAYATGYRLSAAGNATVGLNLLDIGRNHVIVRDIEIDGAGSVGGSTAACVRLLTDTLGGTVTVLFERCLLYGSDADGVRVEGNASLHQAVFANCVIADNTAAGVAAGTGGYTLNRVRLAGTTLAYNGTSLLPFSGWEFEATGCLSAHNTTEWISGTFNPGTSDWNTTTGAYTPGANGQASATVAFVAPLTGDYRVTPATYTGFTSKPGAAVVAAAVAGWPDVAWFDTTVDLKAWPRPEPHQPGALGLVPVPVDAYGALPKLGGSGSAVSAPPVSGAAGGPLPALGGSGIVSVADILTGAAAGVLPLLTGAAAGSFAAAVDVAPHVVLRVRSDALAARVNPDALAAAVQPERLGVAVR